VLTHETPDLLMTSAYLQLEQNKIELTAAANQIATLQSQSNVLKTQLSAAATKAAGSDDSDDDSSGGGGSDDYEIPSNVYTVVTIAKTLVYFSKRNNSSGYPIMEIYEPRVKFDPGTLAWVYKPKVRADGGGIFYQSYDPDGQSELKVYFRLQDIQIRLISGSPDPFTFPPKAAKAEFKEKSVVYVVKGYDQGNKPIMKILEPRIKYYQGDTEILVPNFVVATGGSHFFPIYDPDGKPSTFVREQDVFFLPIWD
jgi:hypothetical protein